MQYKMAWETRNLEVGLFWSRSNFFLAFNTVVAAGFFTVDDVAYARLLSALGAVVAMLWVQTNFGSKYWQSRWEHRLHRAEAEAAMPLRLFRDSWRRIDTDVRRSLQNTRGGDPDEFARVFNCHVLTKPSVTRNAITLSCVVLVFWVAAFVLTWFTNAPPPVQ